MRDLEVIDEPAVAATVLEPLRGRILARLAEPGSAALGAIAADPDRTDRPSAADVVSLAARIVREVAEPARAAERTGRSLATSAIDTEIRFGSPADRAAFTGELVDVVAGLAARDHDESSPDGRWRRPVVAAHPRPAPEREE